MRETPLTYPPDIEQYKTLLRKHSLKATPQRIAVHEAMLGLGHASADEVAEAIIKQGNVRITTASVYNILSQMTMLGIYSHRLGIGGKMVFDVTTGMHIHLYDTVNGTYRDIEDGELMGMVVSRLGKKRFRGYRVDGIDISILCHPSNMKKFRR